MLLNRRAVARAISCSNDKLLEGWNISKAAFAVWIEPESLSGLVPRVDIAARLLLSVIVCAFFICRTIGTGYGTYSVADDVLVPYRSLLGINENEAAGTSRSSTIVHPIHYCKKTSWWGLGGVPRREN